MALSPTAAAAKKAADKENENGTENGTESGAGGEGTVTGAAGATGGELSQEMKDVLATKDAEIASLKKQLEDAGKAAKQELDAEKEGRLKDATAKDGRISELEQALAEAQAAAGDKTKEVEEAVKPKMITVVSCTDRSYLIENGIRVHADRPVKAEWRPGNLLDANMKAGLIQEFEA